MTHDFTDFTKNALKASKLLKVISHPDRLLVLCHLSSGELSAGDLALKSKLKLSAFSQHLAILRKAKLVQIRREAQFIYYSIKDESVLSIMLALKGIYCPTLK